MALREFSDRRGVLWLVWEVIPERVDRRRGRERRKVARPEAKERRQHLDEGMLRKLARALGWLVFESRHEKRRYRPLPDGWDQLPQEELEKLLVEAESVGPPRRLLE